MRAADASHGLTIEPLGETVLLLRLGSRVDGTINARVHDIATCLRDGNLRGVVDIVPAYAALALHYDPAAWSASADPPWRTLADAVRGLLGGAAHEPLPPMAPVDVPVCYGGRHGTDLAELAQRCGLGEAEVIACHTRGDYRVAMLGFAPGFPYLLGLDPILHTPRRANPRLRVPAGSVAIGGAQTGIYPAELPGGWQLIGQTPRSLFDPLRDPPCLFAAGDRVRFRAIDEREFADILARTAP